MEDIYVQIQSQIDPFRIHQAVITSPDLLLTWALDKDSFDPIVALASAVEHIPSNLQLALEVSQSDLTNTQEEDISIMASLINRFIWNKALKMEVNIRTNNHGYSQWRQQIHTFRFNTDNKTIFRSRTSTIKQEYVSFQKMVEIIVASLQAMKTSLQAKDHLLFSSQMQALYKILDLVKVYSFIYLRFVHEIWARATSVRSMYGIQTSQLYAETIEQLSTSSPFASTHIEKTLKNNLNMNCSQFLERV